MKKINRIKLALDVLMLVTLLLMYRKNVLGMTFHEIGGIAVCGLFIIHILLNGQWVMVVTGRLFSSKAAWRLKLNWLVDFLLLLCMAYILISGIFISKVLFDGQSGASVFKTGHYAVSALALALVGLHLGLHYEFVITHTPARRLPLGFRRVTAIVMSVLILALGVYEMTATSFLHWMGNLSAIIGAGETLPEGGNSEPEPLALTGDIEEGTHTDGDETEVRGGRGKGARDGSGKGQGNGGGNTAADPSALGEVLLGFLSITLAFSAVVAWIGGFLRVRKRKMLLRKAQTA